MPLTPEQITRTYPDDGSSVQRINHRKQTPKLTIVDYNPAWPARFQAIKSRIEAVLDPATIILIQHQGSTSVPDLPAKDIIDVDLVVANIQNEQSYTEQLQKAGFLFLFREPAWHEHRFFVDEGPALGENSSPENEAESRYPIHLHVFGPDCPLVEKHRIFRDWLVKTPVDRKLYADVKKECAAASDAEGENMHQYTMRKNEVVSEILNRAFRDLGYIE